MQKIITGVSFWNITYFKLKPCSHRATSLQINSNKVCRLDQEKAISLENGQQLYLRVRSV